MTLLPTRITSRSGGVLPSRALNALLPRPKSHNGERAPFRGSQPVRLFLEGFAFIILLFMPFAQKFGRAPRCLDTNARPSRSGQRSGILRLTCRHVEREDCLRC